MPFLQNAWYVAGSSEEIAAGQMLARRILDSPLLLMRGERDIGELKPTSLKIDKGAVFARRKLDQLIALESAGQA